MLQNGPASMQVDETNFKAALGQNALDAMEIIINRSKHMAASVAEYRQAQGGLATLKRQVLQTSTAERGGCLPNEAEAPLVDLALPLHSRTACLNSLTRCYMGAISLLFRAATSHATGACGCRCCSDQVVTMHYQCASQASRHALTLREAPERCAVLCSRWRPQASSRGTAHRAMRPISRPS